VFGNTQTGAYLLLFRWFKIERHILVRGTASPDAPRLRDYWTRRTAARAKDLRPGLQTIAKNQDYVCPVCGETLFNDEEIHTHHVEPWAQGGTDGYANLTLTHLYCHHQIHNRDVEIGGPAIMSQRAGGCDRDLLEPRTRRRVRTVLRGPGDSSGAPEESGRERAVSVPTRHVGVPSNHTWCLREAGSSRAKAAGHRPPSSTQQASVYATNPFTRLLICHGREAARVANVARHGRRKSSRRAMR